jgi:hypothetical protein
MRGRAGLLAIYADIYARSSIQFFFNQTATYIIYFVADPWWRLREEKWRYRAREARGGLLNAACYYMMYLLV